MLTPEKGYVTIEKNERKEVFQMKTKTIEVRVDIHFPESNVGEAIDKIHESMLSSYEAGIQCAIQILQCVVSAIEQEYSQNE